MAMIDIHEFSASAEILGAKRDISFSGDSLLIRDVGLPEVRKILQLLESGHVSGIPVDKLQTEAAAEFSELSYTAPEEAPALAMVEHPVTVGAQPKGVTVSTDNDEVKYADIETGKLADESDKEEAPQEPVKKKRTRRTKKEMEAANKAEKAKAQEPEVQGSPEPPEQEEESDPLEEDTSLVEDVQKAEDAPEDDSDDNDQEEAPTAENNEEQFEGDEKVLADLLKCTSLRDVIATFEDNGYDTSQKIADAAVKYKSICPVLSRIEESKLVSRVTRTARAMQIA
jgi:hypothetical protein